MKKPLDTKKILVIRCPTCGAAPKEKYDLVMVNHAPNYIVTVD